MYVFPNSDMPDINTKKEKKKKKKTCFSKNFGYKRDHVHDTFTIFGSVKELFSVTCHIEGLVSLQECSNMSRQNGYSLMYMSS